MTIKPNARLLTILAAGFLLSSTALAEDESSDESEAAAEEEKVCINSRQVNGFDALDDEHVLVEEGVKDYFLLTMDHRCPGLRHANGIAFKDTTSRICSDGFGNIVFRDMGRTLTSCRIGPIERVADKDEAEALIAAREGTEE